MPFFRRALIVGTSLLLAACGEDPIAPDVTPAALLLEGGSGTTGVGDTLRLTALVVNAAGRLLPGVAVAWQSTNASVASVDDAGHVAALEAGTTAIIARVADVADTVALRVEVQPRAIVLDGPDSVMVGYSFGYSARVVDGRGRTLYPAPVAFAFDDPNLATAPTVATDQSSMSSIGLETGQLVVSATNGGVRASRTVRITLQSVRLDTTGLTQVGLGYGHVCGLGADGHARCFGWNFSGALGRGTPVGSSTIGAVAGDLAFAQLEVDGASACGITPQRRLWCWGAAAIPARSMSPMAILPDLEIAQVSIGSQYGFDYRQHACALTTAGEAWCWSGDESGGNVAPARVDTARRFRTIDVGGTERTCGVTTTDRVACWRPQAAPVELPGSYPAFMQLAVADTTACGLAAAGAVWCWSIAGTQPTALRRRLEGQQVTTIGATRASQCALTTGGDLWCWDVHPAWDSPYSSHPLPEPRRLAPADRFQALVTGAGAVCGRYASGGWGCIGGIASPSGEL